MTQQIAPDRIEETSVRDAPFKEIVVFIGPSDACERTIRFAAETAKTQNARLVGVYVAGERSQHLGFVRGTDAMANALIKADARELREANEQGARLVDLASQHGVEATFRIVWHDFDMNRRIVGSALLADLVIAGLDDPSSLPDAWHPDKFMSLIGAPLLGLPTRWDGVYPPKRIMIAWNETKQARRAALASIPFLKRAEDVVILSISEDEREGIDLSLYLDRQGIPCKLFTLPPGQKHVAETIAQSAEDIAADMIVMGAYGHSKAVRLVFGGTTQKVLGRTRVPVFMSR
jgi:nucleotide-binding universal stress UspA family protein